MYCVCIMLLKLENDTTTTHQITMLCVWWGEICCVVFWGWLVGRFSLGRTKGIVFWCVFVVGRMIPPKKHREWELFFCLFNTQRTKNAVEQNRTNYYLDFLLRHADFEIFFFLPLSLCLHNFSVRFSSTQLDHLTHLIGNIVDQEEALCTFSEGRENSTSQSLFTFSSSQHKKKIFSFHFT